MEGALEALQQGRGGARHLGVSLQGQALDRPADCIGAQVVAIAGVHAGCLEGVRHGHGGKDLPQALGVLKGLVCAGFVGDSEIWTGAFALHPTSLCCHLVACCSNMSMGLVDELSLEFCATELNRGQLKLWDGPGRSEQIGLMVYELIGGKVEQRGLDVAGVVCEQKVLALLDEGKVLLFGSVDDIAIGYGEIEDFVVAE